MTNSQPSRWQELAGHVSGEDYGARIEALAAEGGDMHGEAALIEQLAPARGRILDAGCGTGRVAIELDRRGFTVVGTDVDPSMLAVARRSSPELAWVLADLATLDLSTIDLEEIDTPSANASQARARQLLAAPFDLVVAAGNVIPLLAAGTEAGAIAAMTSHLAPGGLLVTGFGLDVAHLPLDDVPVVLDDLDHWCAAVGLTLESRWATWDTEPFDDGGYAVSVHRLA